MSDKNPLHEKIDSQMHKQRNNKKSQEDEPSSISRVSQFFTLIIALSVIAGLIATLLGLFS